MRYYTYVGQDNRKINLKILNRDMLKYIALILMACGHMIIYVGVDHFVDMVPLWIIRFFVFGEMFAPPVFFFFISEGFRYTKSRRKYILRLAAVTLITQIPFYFCNFCGEPWWTALTTWSVMAALLAGLLVLAVWESGWRLPLRIIVMLAITALTALMQAEWLVFGPVAIFLFYMTREKPVLRFILFEALMLAFKIYYGGFAFGLTWNNYGFFLAQTAAMVVITFFYNGKKGRFPTFSKWVFYVFYPLHLLAAFLIRTFCF